MKTKIKCFWCKGKSKVGVHSKCWKVFTGFMLSKRSGIDIEMIDDPEQDEYQPTGQDYTDNQGRNVVQGRTMPTNLSNTGFE